MKNKSAIYIVLPIVIGLWAYVIYKLLQIYKPSDQETFAQSSFTPPSFNFSANDTFSIKANYRDPFLGKIQADKTEPLQPIKSVIVIQTKSVTTISWPVISYGGIIKSRKSNNQMCMVSINGQSIFMKEGDINSDILLKKVYNDSILVVFNKQTKFIKK